MTAPSATISPFVQRVRLARTLIEIREAAGLSQDQAAKLAGVARQTVNRAENVVSNLERGIDPENVHRILVTCQVSEDSETYRRAMAVARAANREGWWSTGYSSMGERQRRVADVELGASVIREYQPSLPTGLTQTVEFARYRAGQFTSGSAGGPIDVGSVPQRGLHVMGDRPSGGRLPDTEGIVRGRLRRQQVALSGVETYEVVLEEKAVRRSTAPAAVLRDQLYHLVMLSEQRNISIRILPLDANLPEGRAPTTAFSVYSYPDPECPQVAVVDATVAEVFLLDPDTVSGFAQQFVGLRGAALSDAESAAFIRKIADDIPVAGV